MSSYPIRIKRLKLFYEQQGRCYWCGCEMISPEFYDQSKAPQPDNLATLDHLDNKLSNERGKHHGEKRRIAACRKCNQQRGRLDELVHKLESLS